MITLALLTDKLFSFHWCPDPILLYTNQNKPNFFYSHKKSTRMKTSFIWVDQSLFRLNLPELPEPPRYVRWALGTVSRKHSSDLLYGRT